MGLPKSKLERAPRGEPRIPPKLELCRSCAQFIYPDAVVCPHCAADVFAVNSAYYEALKRARRAAFEVEQLLRRLGKIPSA